MSNRLLCVWLPNWPIQRVQAEEPRLANAPLVLSVRDPRRGMLVAAANLAARREGIKPAMRLSEATALSDVEIREHDPHDDIDALCTLAEQAQQFSPIVGLEQLDKKLWAGRHLHQPQSLLLDVTGLASLFGGEPNLVLQIGEWLSEQNYFGCMSVAGSVGAAWAIANYALRGSQQTTREGAIAAESNGCGWTGTLPSRNPDRSATSPSQELEIEDDETQYTAPPCRSCIVPVGMDEVTLGSLQISALRLSTDSVESLRRLGIRAIGQLDTLPRDGLATRLGEQLITRWDQIYGRKLEPIVTLYSRPEWCLEQSLEYPTTHYETLCEILRRLIRELSQRLANQGTGVLRLVCRLDQVQSQPVVLQLGLFRPTNDAAHLELLLSGQLEQQMRFLQSAPIWKISLQATLTAPMVWRQANLFDGGEAANRGQMARLVDTLSARLGRKNVLSASSKRESQPELAYTLQPLTGRRKDGSEQATIKKLSSRLARYRAEPSRDDPLRRPSHLFKLPVAIEVRLADGNLERELSRTQATGTTTGQTTPASNGLAAAGPLEQPRQSGFAKESAKAPQEFKFQGMWHQVTEACGPERLESGWWRGPSARRDYYRVATSQGSWWWLFYDLTSGHWYMHGLFD